MNDASAPKDKQADRRAVIMVAVAGLGILSLFFALHRQGADEGDTASSASESGESSGEAAQ